MSAQVSTAAAPWRRIQAMRKVALSPLLNTSWTSVTDRPASDMTGGLATRTRLGPGSAAIEVSATRSRSTGTPRQRRFSPSDARNRSDPEPTPTRSRRWLSSHPTVPPQASINCWASCAIRVSTSCSA
jgi:hypothetical protein